ncbi:MAG TPA: PDZ domain-containing protein, partial [Sneathiellales bacterium]|nr:PDZ domain-containing protein [Sneathiellales bacterium]
HGSDAARKGVRAGDLVLTVGTLSVETAEEFLKVVEEASENKKKVVLLYLYRSGDRRYVAVKIDNNGDKG